MDIPALDYLRFASQVPYFTSSSCFVVFDVAKSTWTLLRLDLL